MRGVKVKNMNLRCIGARADAIIKRRALSTAQACIALLLSATLYGGCTSEELPPVAETVPNPVATTPVARAVAVEGTISTSINGTTVTFDNVLADHTYSTGLASQIMATTAAQPNPRFRITFASLSLRNFDYPAELPPPKDFSKPMDPMLAGAMVGFGYIDADGTEWAGPGKIRVESFKSDGIITGSFSDVSIPHTQKELPDAVLTDGTFRVRLIAAW